MYQMKLDRIPDVTNAGRIKQVPGKWSHNGTMVRNPIFMVMLFGECDFIFEPDDRRVRVRQGEMMVIPAWVRYRGACQQPCEYYFFHPELPMREVDETEMSLILSSAEQTMREHTQDNRYLHPPAAFDCLFFDTITDVSGIMSTLTGLFSKCDLETARQDVNRKLRMNLYFSQILTLASECAMRELTRRPAYPAALNHILTYIYENYTSRLTLESLSERFGLTRQYIGLLFRKHLGTTATHFITDLKLSHAPELLTRSSLNVNEIAEYLGFANAYYFSRLFRQKYAVSPTKYR